VYTVCALSIVLPKKTGAATISVLYRIPPAVCAKKYPGYFHTYVTGVTGFPPDTADEWFMCKTISQRD
jgi:hypothetical protein